MTELGCQIGAVYVLVRPVRDHLLVGVGGAILELRPHRHPDLSPVLVPIDLVDVHPAVAATQVHLHVAELGCQVGAVDGLVGPIRDDLLVGVSGAVFDLGTCRHPELSAVLVPADLVDVHPAVGFAQVHLHVAELTRQVPGPTAFGRAEGYVLPVGDHLLGRVGEPVLVGHDWLDVKLSTVLVPANLVDVHVHIRRQLDVDLTLRDQRRAVHGLGLPPGAVSVDVVGAVLEGGPSRHPDLVAIVEPAHAVDLDLVPGMRIELDLHLAVGRDQRATVNALGDPSALDVLVGIGRAILDGRATRHPQLGTVLVPAHAVDLHPRPLRDVDLHLAVRGGQGRAVYVLGRPGALDVLVGAGRAVLDGRATRHP